MSLVGFKASNHPQQVAKRGATNRDNLGTDPVLFAKLDTRFHFTLDVCATPANAKCSDYITLDVGEPAPNRQPLHGGSRAMTDDIAGAGLSPEFTIELATVCVVCPGCAFTFDRNHTDEPPMDPPTYTCPNCDTQGTCPPDAPVNTAVLNEAYKRSELVSLAGDFWNYLEEMRGRWEADDDAPLIDACIRRYEELIGLA